MFTLFHGKNFAALTVALITAGICAFPMRASAEDFPTRTVRYADLDVAKPAGAKALYLRIRVAAKQVCELSTDNDAVLQMAAHACIEKAIDRAVRSVNAPALTALRFGSDPVRLVSR